MGPGTTAWFCPEFPCLPFGTRSPSGLVSGFCAAIKFRARIKKKQRDTTLIVPWGSFISVTSFLFGLCCVCRTTVNRGSRDKYGLFSPHWKYSVMNWPFVFLAQHEDPEGGSACAAAYHPQNWLGK